jgi:hypothetical protein
MPHNEWFKKFAQEHQQGIDSKLEKAYGKGSTFQKTMAKAGVNMAFKQRFSKYIAQANVFRKNVP